MAIFRFLVVLVVAAIAYVLVAPRVPALRGWYETNACPYLDRVNFNVAVGTVIPGDVELHACPGRVVEIHPAWRGCHYVVVQNRIVIVDSGRRIVEVIQE